MKNKFFYIGGFPPPYGGVTVKNELMYNELCKHREIVACRKNSLFFEVLHVLKGLLFAHGFVIGSGSTEKLFLLTKFLFIVCPRKMSRSIVFVMGGSMADSLLEKHHLVPCFAAYQLLYIETRGMAKKLENMGLTNLSILPNCRKQSSTAIEVRNTENQMKCVFFSQISRDKGADKVLSAARQLSNVQFDFYGALAPDYAEAFKKELDAVPNAAYRGVFQVQGDNVYHKLNEYDLLLLPTQWRHEGVPGVLVEAKIAAVPAIVSDFCYNSEIVENGISGTVLTENTAEKLVEAIQFYDKNRDQLAVHKKHALRSAEAYFVENYIDEILNRMNLLG